MRTTTLYTKIDALTDANARIARIAQQLCGTRSKWSQGVCEYIDELLDEYSIDAREILKLDDDERTHLRTSVDDMLLNGASSWDEYSRAGCSLRYEWQICDRLATPSEQKRTRGGKYRPNRKEDWIACQARALYQAAYWIKCAAHELRLQLALEVERAWKQQHQETTATVA